MDILKKLSNKFSSKEPNLNNLDMEHKILWWNSIFCKNCPLYNPFINNDQLLQKNQIFHPTRASCSLFHAIYPKEAVQLQATQFMEENFIELAICQRCGIKPILSYDEEEHPKVHCSICKKEINAKGYGLSTNSEKFLASALWNQKEYTIRWKERLDKSKNIQILNSLFDNNTSYYINGNNQHYDEYSEDDYAITLMQKGFHDYDKIQNLLENLKDNVGNHPIYQASVKSQTIAKSLLEYFASHKSKLIKYHLIIDYFQDRMVSFLENYLFNNMPNKILEKYEEFFINLPKLYQKQYCEIMKPNFSDIEAEIIAMERMMIEYGISSENNFDLDNEINFQSNNNLTENKIEKRKRNIRVYDILSLKEKEALLDMHLKRNNCSIKLGLDSF